MTLEKRQQHRNGEGKKKRQHRNGTKKAGRNIIGTAEPMDKVRWQNSQTEVSERRKSSSIGTKRDGRKIQSEGGDYQYVTMCCATSTRVAAPAPVGLQLQSPRIPHRGAAAAAFGLSMPSKKTCETPVN